jgi:SAM-dependent methyltransferase
MMTHLQPGGGAQPAGSEAQPAATPGAVDTRAGQPAPGLLGDTAARDYSFKLQCFNEFAAPELRQSIANLGLRPGMRILDAGCGTGQALRWLWDQVQPDGEVVGIDLATSHVSAARATAPPGTTVLQGDFLQAPLPPRSFDLIWCVNTINHLHDPVRGVETLAALLRPGGRIALGQSSVLPDMFFAWDARLERLTNEAVRQYYRDRYGLNERDLTAVRSIFGLPQRAQLRDVTVRSVLIERVAPLDAAAEAYIQKTIFRDTWGERLQPYLDPADYEWLRRLCDPADPECALRRPDFHFLQTFTLVTGRI